MPILKAISSSCLTILSFSLPRSPISTTSRHTNFTHLPPNRFVFQFEHPDSINHLVVFLTGIGKQPNQIKRKKEKEKKKKKHRSVHTFLQLTIFVIARSSFAGRVWRFDPFPVPEQAGVAAARNVRVQRLTYCATTKLAGNEKQGKLTLGLLCFSFSGGWCVETGRLSGTKPSAIFRLKGTTVRSQQDWTGAEMGGTATATAMLGILVGPLAEIEASCSALNSALAVRTNPCSNPQASTPGLLQLAKAIGLNLFTYIASFASSPFDNQTWIPIAVLEKWWKQFELKLANSPNPEQWLLDSSSAG
jgi:hypothetical protein